MVVRPPSPEASESEHGGGPTVVPEWQLADWDDYDFPEGAVEREEEVAQQQIHSLQCWVAYLALLLRILPFCCTIFHYLQRVILQE
jgi:hypothetical protein